MYDNALSMCIGFQAVMERIGNFKPLQANADIERSLLKCFAGLHAKLQRIEKNLLQSVASAADAELLALQTVEGELTGHMNNVTSIIYEAQQFLDQCQGGESSPCNVQEILEKMLSIQNIPHSLQTEHSTASSSQRFEYIPFADDWENHFKLNTAANVNYKLCNDEQTAIENMDDSSSSSVTEVTIGDENSQSIFVSSGDQVMAITRQALNAMEPTCTKQLNNVENSAYKALFEEFEPPSLFAGALINVVITHIDSPASIFVQLTKNYTNLHILQKHLQEDGTLAVSSPVKRKIYLVKYLTVDPPQWRRGVVESVDEATDTCQVQLIDFGNKLKCTFENLRELSEEIQNLPPFAIECRLFNLVEPQTPRWNNNDASFIAAAISGYNITMCVHNINNLNVPEVDFKISSSYDDTDFSLRDSLIFLGRGSQEHADVNVDDDLTVEAPEIASTFEFPSHSFEFNSKDIVYITKIVNAVTVFVQLASSTDIYVQLKASMNKFYTRDPTFGRVYAPKVGMAVAIQHCLSATKPYWHRGIVTVVNNGQGTVLVELVDCGEVFTVSGDNIRFLHKKFRDLEMLATKVKLSHISYNTEQENAASVAILSPLAWKPLKMVVHAFTFDAPEVILFDYSTNEDMSINTKLAQEGLTSTGFLSTIVEWNDGLSKKKPAETDFVTSTLMKQCQGSSETESLDATEEDEDESEGLQLESVEVLSVINPHCIYVHKSDNEDFRRNLTQFELKLQKYYSCNFLNTRKDWKLDEVAIAYDRTQKQFFRVYITKLPTVINTDYQVIGQDFGNVFNAPLEAIGELAEEFNIIPPLGLKVKLYGIAPMSSWSLTAIDFLSELIVGKKNIFLTIIGDQEPLEVVLWNRQVHFGGALERNQVKMINVNKTLCKNGLALLSKDWHLPKVKVEAVKSRKQSWLPAEPLTQRTFEGRATNISDDGHVYFTENSDMNMLFTIERQINEEFSDHIPEANMNWNVGDCCIAKYYLNQKWYRAEVVSLDAQSISVRMIDYGNVEKVKYNEISKELRFVKIPRLAKLVSLHSVHPEGGTHQLHLLDKLHVFVVEHNISGQIVETANGNLPASAIVQCNGVNVNSFMLNEMNSIKWITQMSTNGCGSSENRSVSPAYTYAPLPPTTQFEIVLVHCIGTTMISFHLQGNRSIDNRMTKLALDINSNWGNQPILREPTENLLCIAQAADKKWHRAKIMKSKGVLHVYFVDYGYLENLGELRQMKTEWLKDAVEMYIATVDRENLRVIMTSVQAGNTKVMVKVIERTPLIVELYQ